MMHTSGKNFCAWCGGGLERKPAQGALRLVCGRCGRITYENPITGVAGIILSPEGKILLGLRGAKETKGGRWCIPCGHVEYNEDIRHALVREMREETGFLVRPLCVYETYSNFHEPAAHSTGVWFLAEAAAGYAKSGDDVDAVRFFSACELPQLAFDTDKPVIEKLIKEGLLQ